MLHVVARTLGAKCEWSRRHPNVPAEFHVDRSSYYEVLQDIIWDLKSDYALVVHDDVFLSDLIIEDTRRLVSELDSEWPAWGVCGNAGVLLFSVGFQKTSIVRYLRDPHGGPNFQGAILPAQSIDGNVMLLNLRSLRKSGVHMPPFEGFHFYDIILCVEALCHDLSVLVAPHLASVHLSAGSQEQFDRAALSEGLRDYLSDRLENTELQTLNGKVRVESEKLPDSDRLIDIEMQALRAAALGRPKRSVAIVVRTRFREPRLLQRTLETAKSFAVAAGEVTEFTVYLVTDQPDECPAFVSDYATIMRMDAAPGDDSRFRLVQFASRIECDYLWFLDDDDWLFPNEAERLGLCINVAPKSTIFFFDTESFNERIGSVGSSALSGSYSVTEGRYYCGRDWVSSLSGENYVPFCGMIVPVGSVRALSGRMYDHVIYFEDYAIQLNCLVDPSMVQIVIDKLFAGISVRETGNSITSPDRSRWDKSYAEMIACICRDKKNPGLLSVWGPAPVVAQMQPPSIEVLHVASKPPMEATSKSERLLLLTYRFLLGVLVFATQPRRWRSRIKNGYRVLRSEGLASAFRWTTVFWRGM